ncbi:efflux RND transporter periplasmic adaptor subunit [Elongatibacter sediminis]|uniref:Efflux RND transporter periplasmic adaptor subunit n=1 Tax=Elongatibacter sediminis TaxID=3119006 RepID=A0AAW9R7K3_9GAMM
MHKGIRDTSAQDVARERPNRKRRIMVLGLVVTVVLALALAAVNALGTWLATDLSVSGDRIRTARVQRGDLLRDVNVQGRIVAAVSPTLYSPAAGTVTLHVQPGDEVTTGMELALLHSPEVESEFEQEASALAGLRAEVERQKIQARKDQVTSQQVIDLARVELTAAQREMRRAEQSLAIQAISQIDYERYRDDLARAEVEFRHAEQDAELERDRQAFEIRTKQLAVEQQQLLVNNLKRRVDDLTIRSPVSGIVGNVAVEQKAAVAPNQPLVTVVDLSAFEVEVRIPEAYADDLGIGMPAEVQYNARQYAADLTSLSPEVINSEVTGRLRFRDAAPPGLRQNQRVTARIVMDRLEAVLTLQRGAFADSAGGRIAFVLGADGIARKRTVVLGARSVNRVEVVDGLSEGEQVVISSIAEFEDKETIRVVD